MASDKPKKNQSRSELTLLLFVLLSMGLIVFDLIQNLYHFLLGLA